MLNAGNLDKRIEVWGVTEITDEYGTHTQDGKIYSCWAMIAPLRGKEYYEADKVQNEDNYKITIRYRKNMKESYKIHYRNNIFEIQSVVNPYMSNESLELYCIAKTRGVDNG
jgi:SPP1 family predicted phage head-tail adaptor